MAFTLPRVSKLVGEFPSQAFPHLATLDCKCQHSELSNLAASWYAGTYPFGSGAVGSQELSVGFPAFPAEIVNGKHGHSMNDEFVGQEIVYRIASSRLILIDQAKHERQSFAGLLIALLAHGQHFRRNSKEFEVLEQLKRVTARSLPVTISQEGI